MKITKKKIFITIVLAAFFIVIVALDFLFIPGFNDKYFGIKFSRIQERYNFDSISKIKIKAQSLMNTFEESFSIPIDEKYELFLYKTDEWSKYRGSYRQWFLYPEPLYRSNYVKNAKNNGETLNSTDYCKHYLSEYIRNQTHFMDALATQWRGEAIETPDGNYAFSIGRHIIAGLGYK